MTEQLIQRSEKPYNAEPQPGALIEQFLIPQALFYVRSHGAVPALPADHRIELSGGFEGPLISAEELRTAFRCCDRGDREHDDCAGRRWLRPTGFAALLLALAVTLMLCLCVRRIALAVMPRQAATGALDEAEPDDP